MELIKRTQKRDVREYVTEAGDLVIARRDAGVKADLAYGEWLVTATSSDDSLAQVQGTVWMNEAGFRGRQWESSIDGQQHPTLKSAMEAAVERAQARARSLAFFRRA